MKRIPLHFSILIGMVSGLAFGFFFPQFIPYLRPLGDLFIRLLKMLVIPLILVSVIDGIAQAGNLQKLSRLGFKTAAYYMGTNALAVLTSLIFVNWIQPGRGVTFFGGSAAVPKTSFGISDLVPANFFQALAEGQALPILFMAFLFGTALVVMGPRTPRLRELVSEANHLLLTVTSGIILLAPIGVFGLMVPLAHALDWQAFLGVGKFAAVILISLLIHGFLTLPVLFKTFSDRSVALFAKQMEPALLSAFSTSSSSATLPLTLKCVEEKAGIPRDIAGFVLPVGATVNMDGTAIYEAAACLFVAQAVGVDLSLAQQIVVFFIASLAAVGAASIPSAGLVTLAMVLTAVGLPLEGIGFLLAIDRPLDMSRTVINVWGDAVGCAVVEGKKGAGNFS